jgi:hypothetical protein
MITNKQKIQFLFLPNSIERQFICDINCVEESHPGMSYTLVSHWRGQERHQ